MLDTITIEEVHEAAENAARLAYTTKYAEIGDAGAAGFVSIRIPVDAKHRPLIRRLDENGTGRFDGYRCEWAISPSDFLERNATYIQSMTVQEAGCRAFAAALQEAGFSPTVHSVLD